MLLPADMPKKVQPFRLVPVITIAMREMDL
jgi:hypothetical protein